MLVLGIESSCDETAAAVYDGRHMLSDIVSSQNDIHHKYGGIVPELASRRHIEIIAPVVHEALLKAEVDLDNIEGISVTQGPGLVGALLVGISFAKALSYSQKLPIAGVNHIEAHLTAALIEKDISFPYLGLVVSGGHTSLYIVKKIGSYRHLGSTRDDAAGEALDKAGKLLGLGYPAGALIDRLAMKGDPKAIRFPRAIIHNSPFDFSFSGLKTFLANLVSSEGRGFAEKNLEAICAGYLEAVVDMLVDKTLKAATEHQLDHIVISGGVAANSRLRSKMIDSAERLGKKVSCPPVSLCTDNASMVAFLGCRYLESGIRSDLHMNAIPDWPLPEE